MSPRHLTEDSYRRLLSGGLAPAEASEIGHHLARECEACEAFLKRLPPDEVDGRVDRALAAVGRAAGVGGSDLEYARIERGLRRRAAFSGSRRWFAAAAAVLLAGGATLLLGERGSRETGEKGATVLAAPARLRFAVVEPGSGAPEFSRGKSGETVPARANLAFRVEVRGATYVALLRIGEGDRDLLWRAHLTRTGAVDVDLDGKPAAYPLKGLSGLQHFVLLSSEAPLRESDLSHVTAAPGLSGDTGRGIGFDEVEVKVE